MNLTRIEDYAAYKDAVAEAKKSGCKRTNCFFLPDQARTLIENGRLLMHRTDGALFLFEDAGSFYRLYYYMDRPEFRLNPDKPVVTEFPFNRELTEEQRIQEEILLSIGFSLGRESAMMTADPSVVSPEKAADSRIQPAREQDAVQIMQLLTDNFDPLYAFIPTMEELCAKIAQGSVLVCLSGGDVAGVLNSSQTKRQAVIDHLAVRDKGMGIGKALVQAFLAKYKESAGQYCHWVDIHNTPAVELYKRFGYSFGVKRANEYIIK